MATINNDRDNTLVAITPRLTTVTLPSNIVIPAVKQVKLSATSTVFKINTAGVSNIPSIDLIASSIHIDENISIDFSIIEGSATLTGTGNTRSLAFADLLTTAVIIRASVTENSITYTDDITIVSVQDGSIGTRTAILEMYKWAVAAPTLFPVGTSSYTWATGQFTDPLDGVADGRNGWARSVGTGTAGETLWIVRKTLVDQTVTAQTTVTWDVATAIAGGTNAPNPSRATSITLYKWATSEPAKPVGTSTYIWASAFFSLPEEALNGWAKVVSAQGNPGDYLYSITVVYTDTNISTTSDLDWANGVISVEGYTPLNAPRATVLKLYKWVLSTDAVPSVFPAGTSTYTWAMALFTDPATLNGWSKSPANPGPGYTLYSCSAAYSDTNTTDQSDITWPGSNTAVVEGSTGENGVRTAELELWKWSQTTPTLFPTGSSVFTWSDRSFTTVGVTLNGWTLTPGASTPGYNLYKCVQTYSDRLTSLTSDVTWSTTTALLVGAAGGTGVNGQRGSLVAYGTPYTIYLSGTTWPEGVDTTNGNLAARVIWLLLNNVTTPITAMTDRSHLVIGDTVTLVDSAGVIAKTMYWSGASTGWKYPGTVIDGNLLVTGTIDATKLVTGLLAADNVLTRGLTVRDSNGTILLATGVPLDFSNIGGATKPANNATVGKSLGLPFNVWDLNGQSLVTISDGKVGNTALRLSGVSGGYPNQGNYIPIDYSKKYRARFWARPSATTTGLLYFSLRQFLNSSGTPGPTNGGRSPYKPSAVSRSTHITNYGDTWGEYNFLWSSSDWQANVAYVQPEFLDNYSIQTGYWEIQDFTLEEVTEVLTAATTANWSLVADRPTTLAALDATAASDLDGKTVTYYQIAAPTGTVNDLWFDTDDGNKLYRHNGTSWAVVQDAGIAAAALAASTAQTTADSKITTFYTTSTPTATATGDLWYSTTTKLLKRWSGSAWVDTASSGAPTGTLVGSTLAQTVESNAANGNSAFSSLSSKLDKASTEILTVATSGTVYMPGIRVGNIAWDASGNRTSGTGLALTPSGIVGHNGTNTTFTLNATTGDATFAGTLSAANMVNTTNITDNAVTNSASAYTAAVVTASTNEFTIQTVSLTTTGKTVTFMGSTSITVGQNGGSSGTISAYLSLRRAGVEIAREGGITQGLSGGGSYLYNLAIQFAEAPTASTHSYTLVLVTNYSGSGLVIRDAQRRFLYASENKK